MGKNYCNGCIYASSMGDGYIICNYFLQTSIRRPCPAGEGCTVKQTGKKLRQRQDENNATRKKEKEKMPKPPKVPKAKSVRTVTLVCRFCGASFQTTDSRRHYCSDDCSAAGKKQYRSDYEKCRRKRGKRSGKKE